MKLFLSGLSPPLLCKNYLNKNAITILNNIKMKNKKLINALFILTFCTGNVNAQWTKSPPTVPYNANVTATYGYGRAKITANSAETKTIAWIFPPKPNNETDTNFDNKKTRALNIFQNRNFFGNPFASTPNDNSIAISSFTIADTIVSVSNRIFYVGLPNGTLLGYNFLDTFCIDAGYSPFINMGDPKVVWDVAEKRFVLSFVSFGYDNGLNLPDKAKHYIAVSKTSNPMDGWHLYELEDFNYLDIDSWFDRPELALSVKSVYTSLQVARDNAPFSYSTIVFGLNKTSLYAGNPTNVDFVKDIIWNNYDTLSSIFPIKGAQGEYGPGLYFLQTPSAGLSTSKDTIRYFDLVDELFNGGTFSATGISCIPYFKSFPFKQPNSSLTIGNNDNRIMDGIFMNNTIQAVFVKRPQNSNQSNESAINILRINTPTQTLQEKQLYYSNKFVCYPSIANFTKKGGTTFEAIINYLKSDTLDLYPSFYAMGIDNSSIFSNELLIRKGTISKTIPNWGDYTGSCRKHDAIEPTVWVIGTYVNDPVYDSVWISEIIDHTPLSINQNIKNEEFNVMVYPNPISNQINIKSNLTLNKSTITLRSLNGKIISYLWNGDILNGRQYTFPITNLTEGLYLLTIKNKNYEQNSKLLIR